MKKNFTEKEKKLITIIKKFKTDLKMVVQVWVTSEGGAILDVTKKAALNEFIRAKFSYEIGTNFDGKKRMIIK